MMDAPFTRRRLLCASMGVLSCITQPVFARDAMNHQTPPLETGFAQGDGVRLHYARRGAGPLMLCLHGHPDSWRLYRHQLNEFSRDHLVAAPNLRGYAPSSQPDDVQAYRMPHLLRDIHHLIDHFNRKGCILVGNDWGGYVAWAFASAYPERVERLIIMNAGHPATFLREVRNNPAQIHASQYERGLRNAPPPYPLWYHYYRADPIHVPASLSDSATFPMPDLASHFFANLDDRPPETRTLKVRVPTLVIWGMRDAVVLPGQMNGLEDYVADLTIHRLQDAGHLPMAEQPEIVNRMIRRFIEK